MRLSLSEYFSTHYIRVWFSSLVAQFRRGNLMQNDSWSVEHASVWTVYLTDFHVSKNLVNSRYLVNAREKKIPFMLIRIKFYTTRGLRIQGGRKQERQVICLYNFSTLHCNFMWQRVEKWDKFPRKEWADLPTSKILNEKNNSATVQ